MKVIGGISGPCKIVYDLWYKNSQKSVSLRGHISDRLSVVLVRAEPHKGDILERARGQSVKDWLLGLGKSGHISDRLSRKTSQEYFTIYYQIFHDLRICHMFVCLTKQNTCFQIFSLGRGNTYGVGMT